MKKFLYNKVLLAVMVLGLVASVVINMARIADERANNSINLVVDYEALVELAEKEGLPVNEVMSKAREAGITSLAVYDRTFKKLNKSGKCTATRGVDIMERYRTGSLVSPAWRELAARGEIADAEMYITNGDDVTYREVKEDLVRHLGKDRVRAFVVDGKEVLAVKANGDAFVKLDLGLATDEMKAVNAAGFYVVARPANLVHPTVDDVKAVFRRLDGIKVSEMVFSGNQCLGAFGEEGALEAVAEELKERKITLGLIEATTQLQFFPQEGLEKIAAKLDWQAARSYYIGKEEMRKMKIQQAVDRWKNTDEERNIRISLLMPFEKPQEGMSLLETNLKYFSEVKEALTARNFVFGPAGTFYQLHVAPWLRALVVLGAVAAGVLYLSLVIPALNARRKLQLMMFAVIGVVFCVPVFVGAGNSVRLLAALAGANIFPALAMVGLLDYIRSHRDAGCGSLVGSIVFAFAVLAVTGALSFVGASYLSASLSDVEFFLEAKFFRGIKLTFILPLILVAVAFLQRFNVFGSFEDETESFMAQVKEIMDAPVTVRLLAALGLVGVALIVFIARSGHTMGMPVPGIELKLRAFLEQSLYARPRTKEMFIGHPAFMLMVMAWLKKWPTVVFFALVMVATIAQGSMVETFAHMRTPFMMSAVRGVGGLIFGGIIGGGLMLMVTLWYNILDKARAKMARD